MGLRFKILSGFIILVLMLAIAGIWTILEIKSTGFSIQAILDENYQSIFAGEDMIEALEREDSAILLLLLGNWQRGRDQLLKADSLFMKKLEFAYSNVTIEGEKTSLDTIKSRYTLYKEIWQRPIVDTPKEGSIEWYFQNTHQAFQNVKDALNDFNNLNNTTMYNTASMLKQKSDRAIMPGLIAIIAAILFTLIFNYFVNFFFVNPIIHITERIEQFILKGTPYLIETATHDEIEQLSESIEHLCNYAGKEREK
jgi:methyl-accepting chemotaxis protein